MARVRVVVRVRVRVRFGAKCRIAPEVRERICDLVLNRTYSP